MLEEQEVQRRPRRRKHSIKYGKKKITFTASALVWRRKRFNEGSEVGQVKEALFYT